MVNTRRGGFVPGCNWCAVALSAIVSASAWMAGAEDFHLDERRLADSLVRSPAYDLRPGLKASCRVKFGDPAWDSCERTLIRKGNPNDVGSYLLRANSDREGGCFSWFVNFGNGPEPRLSAPVKPVSGKWYDVAAGWDGTNTWLSVDGKRVSRVRKAPPVRMPGLSLGCGVGPMIGELRDVEVSGPDFRSYSDDHLRPGLSLACEAVFKNLPKGECVIAGKHLEYLLRYDAKEEAGNGYFRFYTFLDGSWEPHSEVKMAVTNGIAYRISAGWNGRATWLAVNGCTATRPLARTGKVVHNAKPLALNRNSVVEVKRFTLRNEPQAILNLADLRTRELLPRLGSAATLEGRLDNVGMAVEGGTLEAKCVEAGAIVTPEKVDLRGIGEGESRPFAWSVDPGTNGFVNLRFTVRAGGCVLCTDRKRLVFLPVKDPDLSARAWQPPVKPTRTYHVDGESGNDSNDGLTPATAWKSFRNASSLTLGPGERLLLRRGCVFNEELRVSAHGSADNWAEIGAYGEGMRPAISRNRFIDDRCGLVVSPSYLVVRDLIFCNAGFGFGVICEKPGEGHILVEHCLAHHIEGIYRFNSHGIPEWRDHKGPPPPCGGRSSGIFIGGIPQGAHHTVLRDCECYQCSSGYSAGGVDAFVNRMYSHDNYAHNTSPHPYNTSSRSWMTDCVFDASGWHAAAGTMGVMLWGNTGWIVRGCHFLNQPDSGSPDQGGIDFEACGENCLVEECTFRNNAGAAIEVLGLRSPQTRNVRIRRCRFDRNNWAFKNGPAEIQVWGSRNSPADVCCSNGLIDDNGYVLVPGVPFYVNETRTTNDWKLVGNRRFDFAEDLDRAYPLGDPPSVKACGEIWTGEPVAALSAQVSGKGARVTWEQLEGPNGIVFENPDSVRTIARFPGPGDYRVSVKADDGRYWRTGRTAVHVLPRGAFTRASWNFARNLDNEGWSVEDAGTDFEFLKAKESFWNSKSFPVRMVCGDYYVIAVKGSGSAAIVSPDYRDVGVSFGPRNCNAMRLRMQNHTDSAQMRLSWQTTADPAWSEAKSVVFAVTPNDGGDSVYTVPLPHVGGIKRLKLSFSASGAPITGTCRIDYIWLGNLPQ